MTEEQEKVYKAVKRDIFEQYKEDTEAFIYKLFGSLQLVSAGIVPKWFQTKQDKPIKLKSPKVASVIEAIESIARRHKKIVFCQYLEEIEAITRALAQAGMSAHAITGGVRPRDRQGRIEAWRDNGEVLVCTTQTMGVGQNLQFANYAIYSTNSFNWLDREQAERRIYRLGMTGAANYIDIRINTGIDKKIRENLEMKGDLIASFKKKIRGMNKEKIREEIEKL